MPNRKKDEHDSKLPKAVKPVEDGPDWDERFVRENADKYGQAGGEPIVQRGPSHSTGGTGVKEHKESAKTNPGKKRD